MFVAQVAKVDCDAAEPVDEARANCGYAAEVPAAIDKRLAPPPPIMPIRGPIAAPPNDAEGNDCTPKLRDAAGKGFVLRCVASLFNGRSVTLPEATEEAVGKWGGIEVTPRTAAADEGGTGKPKTLSVTVAVLALSALVSRDSLGDEPVDSDLFLGSSIFFCFAASALLRVTKERIYRGSETVVNATSNELNAAILVEKVLFT